MLLGSLPLGRSVEYLPGRWAHLSPVHLEEWASRPGLATPVLVEHDIGKAVGWCSRVAFSRQLNRALFFGELDGPDAARVARLVRARVTDGLSPRIRTHPGRVWLQQRGRWGDGYLVELPELSVCQWPKINDARWLGV